MAITSTKTKEYKVLLKHLLKNTLTPGQLEKAASDKFIKMIEAQASGDGSTDVASTALSWATTKPLAVNFLTSSSEASTDFHKVIDGSVSFTTAANGLPATYIALHAETVGNEPKIAGVLALRANGVDSTFTDTDPGLNGNTGGGNALSDAYVMGRYAAWGATKFNAIFNKGLIKAILNESDTNYDTLAEVVAVYDAAWTNAVAKADFFAAFDKFYDAGYTGLKFSDLWADRNSVANFQSHTSTNAMKLMASTGGTWAGVTGLAAQKYADLTTNNAFQAIDKCGATFTSLDTVYTANAVKLNTLLSNNAVGLCSKQYSGFNFAGLSTAYGTTYSTVKDVEFRNIIDTKNWELFQAGLTYANALAAGDKLACIANNNALKADIIGSGIANTMVSDLVTPADFGGFQSLGDLC